MATIKEIAEIVCKLSDKVFKLSESIPISSERLEFPCGSKLSWAIFCDVLRATSPGRGSLSWKGSPWQRGFVFDETDWGLLENVTECQSLPY